MRLDERKIFRFIEKSEKKVEGKKLNSKTARNGNQ